MAVNNNPLQALQDLQAPILFRGLPETISGFAWIFWTAGFLLLIGGHIWRLKECANNARGTIDEWLKTMLIITFMLLSPSFVAWGVTGVKEIQDASGLGNPMAVTKKCVRLAFTFPELESVFSTFARNQQAPAASTTGPDPVSKAVDQGGMWGYTKAFFISLGEEATDIITNSKRAFNALIDGPALIAALITSGLKAVAIAVCGVMVYLFMCGAGMIVWVIDTLRYFLLVTGALLLPTFIAGYSTKAFSNQAHNYVTWMIAVLLWPIGWVLVNIGTVGLFNAYVSLISGSTIVGAGHSEVSKFVNDFKWESIDATVSSASTAAVWAGGAMLTGASAPFLYLLMVALGAVGLFLWIVLGHIGACTLMTKLVTTGASFYGGQVGNTLRGAAGLMSSGSKFAGKTALGAGVVGGVAAAAGGGLLNGAADAADSGSGGGGGGGGGGAGSGAASSGGSQSSSAGGSSSSGSRAANAAAGATSKATSGSGGTAGQMANAVKKAAASLKAANPAGLGLFTAGSMLDGLSKSSEDPAAMASSFVDGIHDYLGAQTTKQETGDELGQSTEQTDLMKQQTDLLKEIAGTMKMNVGGGHKFSKAGKN